MTDNILLTCMLIAPGYFSILIIEMLTSYKEKPRFDKLLDSLIYSLVIWLTFGMFTSKLPPYYLTKEGFTDFVGWKTVLFLIIYFGYSYLMFKNKKNKWLFNYAKKKGLSIKTSHNIPLFEDIFNDSEIKIASIEIQTNDGMRYVGESKNKWSAKWGLHPHTGDVSFVCTSILDKDGKLLEEFSDKDLEQDNYITKTYIPRENIKKIKYVSRGKI